MKDWTIMIYMAGNNNLSEDMVTGLIGMKKSLPFPKNNVALLAFYDTSAIGVPTVLLDFTETIAQNPDTAAVSSAPLTQSIGKVKNSTKSISGFVEWCVREKKYEAENYALIFSGHGDGYQPDTFLSDNNQFGSITLKNLAKTLENLTNPESAGETGWSLGKKFSIIGFDSCVMNTLETADELSGVADLLVGSQGFVPNSGWDYGSFIQKLQNAGSTLEKEDVAEMICSSYIEANKEYAFRSGRSVDISICDLRPKQLKHQEFDFRGIVKGVDSLGKSLLNALKNPLTERQTEQIILKSHCSCQTLILDQAVDIFDFCRILGDESDVLIKQNTELIRLLTSEKKSVELKNINVVFAEISDICRNINSAIEKCVKFYFLGPEYQWSNGLSLFFPWSLRSFALTRKRYLSYKFGGGKMLPRQKSAWVSFLDHYLEKTLRPIRKNFEKDSKKENSLVLSENSNPASLSRNNDSMAAFASAGKKWSMPYLKWNSPNLRTSPGEMLEYFRKTKNFPWLPLDWDVSFAD